MNRLDVSASDAVFDNIISYYTNTELLPAEMNQAVRRTLAPLTTRIDSANALLHKAAEYKLLIPVATTMNLAMRNREYAIDFFHETDSLMTAYGAMNNASHSHLPHVIGTVFTNFFANFAHFSTLAHAFDSSAVPNALAKYHDNTEDYRSLTMHLQSAATHRTASPLKAAASALTRNIVLEMRADNAAHPNYRTVSDVIIGVAAVSRDETTTVCGADIAWRHADNPDMPPAFEKMTRAAMKKKEPSLYLGPALIAYDLAHPTPRPQRPTPVPLRSAA